MPQIIFGSRMHIQPSMLHRNPFSYIYSENNPKNQEPTLPLPYCAVQYISIVSRWCLITNLLQNPTPNSTNYSNAYKTFNKL